MNFFTRFGLALLIALFVCLPAAFCKTFAPPSIAEVKRDNNYLEVNEYAFICRSVLNCQYSKASSNLILEQEIMIENDKILLNGISRAYCESGKLKSEAFFKENKVDAVLKEYYENGRICAGITQKKGKREDVQRIYYENGNLESEALFKNEEKTGLAKSYYENGKLESEIPFKKGKAEGVARAYYENGVLKEETPYKKALKQGEAKQYRENGQLFVSITYAGNEALPGICYHANGQKTPLSCAELIDLTNDVAIKCD